MYFYVLGWRGIQFEVLICIYALFVTPKGRSSVQVRPASPLFTLKIICAQQRQQHIVFQKGKRYRVRRENLNKVAKNMFSFSLRTVYVVILRYKISHTLGTKGSVINS